MFENDYNGDQGDESAPVSAPAAPVPPPLPIPYSQSDDLEVQRLSNGIARVRDQVFDGELHPQEGEQLEGQINGRLQPLLQRKQQTMAAELQQQKMMSLDQASTMQNVQQSNMAHAAKNFESTVASFTNPDTGTTSFHKIQPDGSSDEIGGDQASGDPEEGDGGSGDKLEAIDPADLPPADERPQATRPNTAAREHVMEITNGGWTQRHVFNANTGESLRTEYPKDDQGNEIKPPWVRAVEAENAATTQHGTSLGLSPQEHRSLMAQAELGVPPVRLSGNARQDSINIAKRSQQVSENYRLLTNDLLRQRRDKATDQRKQEAEARKQGPLVSVGKALGITPSEMSKMLENHQKDVAADSSNIDKFKYNGVEYGGPINQLPKPVQNAIAAQRLMEHLTTLRDAGQSAGLIGGGSPGSGASVGGQPGTPPQAPKLSPDVVKRINDRRQSIGLGAEVDAARNRQPVASTLPGQADREKARSWGGSPNARD